MSTRNYETSDLVRSCNTCQHFIKRVDNPRYGECHRYAPRPQTGPRPITPPEGTPRGLTHWNFPLIEQHNICGEFKLKRGLTTCHNCRFIILADAEKCPECGERTLPF